jgi:hypothetical protein
VSEPLPFITLPPEHRQVAMKLTDDLREWIEANVIGQKTLDAVEALNAYPLEKRMRLAAQLGGLNMDEVEAAVGDIKFVSNGEDGEVTVNVVFKKPLEQVWMNVTITDKDGNPVKGDEA